MLVELIQRTRSLFLGKPVAPKRVELRGRPPMRVLRSDGRVFSSQTAAARSLGCGQGEISFHLKGKTKSVRGFTFTAYNEELPRG